MPRPKHQTPREGKRNVVVVELYGPEDDMIGRVVKDSGMKKVEVITRLIKFFAEQDDVMRAYMLGQIPPSIRVDVAKLMLEKIAAEGVTTESDAGAPAAARLRGSTAGQAGQGGPAGSGSNPTRSRLPAAPMKAGNAP